MTARTIDAGAAEALASLWIHLSRIATLCGAAPLNRYPGLWKVTAGVWHLWVNGHREPLRVPNQEIAVQPYQVYVEYNGWPAGVITPNGATIAAGELANVFTLRDSLVELCRSLTQGAPQVGETDAEVR